jgi:hypothetical protein
MEAVSGALSTYGADAKKRRVSNAIGVRGIGCPRVHRAYYYYYIYSLISGSYVRVWNNRVPLEVRT